MKKLKDMCLDCLSMNLDGNISCITRDMTTLHKEQLLQLLVNHDRLTADYLPFVTYNLFTPSMKHVVLYRCEQVNDRMLELLAQSGCRLTELVIVGCKAVTDKGLVLITRDQDELQTVKLKSLPSFTDKGLSALRSPVLETLNLKGSNVTSSGVEMVLCNNPSVRNLILSLCKKLDETVFRRIARHLGRTLEVLEVVNVNGLNDENIVEIAASCPNLTKLNVSGCNMMTDAGLTELCVKCRKLHDLDISLCMKVKNAESIIDLPPCLQSLTLSGVQFTDSDVLVRAMRRLTSLRSIRFCGVPALNDAALEQILESVGGKLELLDLSGGLVSSLSESAVTSIVRHCPVISSLYLSLLKHISGVALLPLLEDPARASRLVRLHLACRLLDADVLHYVAQNCCNLEQLVLSGVVTVDDDFLVKFAANCTSLRYIGLKGCRQVTDVGVCALAAQCHRLACVVLSGAGQLTDRSVLALANNCPYIDEFYVSGCNFITRTAIQYLVDRCIPRVYWEHLVPNVDPDMLIAHNRDTGVYCRIDTAPT